MRVARTVTWLAAVAVLAAACDGGEEAVPEAPVATPTEDVTPPGPDDEDADASTGDEGTQDDADDAPGAADGVPEGPPLATAEHPVAEQDASVAIELRAEETGDLLRVSLTFTPEGTEEGSSLAELLGSSGSGNGMSGRVIDADNLLEYGSVRAPVRHGDAIRVVDGQPVTLHFYVGAPEEPMERFDFLLDFGSGAPNWPGFVDVPYPGA